MARIYDEQCDIEADEQVPDPLEKQGEKPLMSLYDPPLVQGGHKASGGNSQPPASDYHRRVEV